MNRPCGWRCFAKSELAGSRHQQFPPPHAQVLKLSITDPDLPVGFLHLLVGPFGNANRCGIFVWKVRITQPLSQFCRSKTIAFCPFVQMLLSRKVV